MALAPMYGAVGDGKTDDTDALQHAINDGDGCLELPRGDFRLTRPLIVDLTRVGRTGIVGAAGTTRLLMDGPGPAIRILGSHLGTAVPSSLTPQTVDRERFPVVTGLEIAGRHPEAVGIELRKTMQPTISHVLIRQCQHGIHLVERNRNVLIANCHLYDNHEFGIFFDRCNLHQTIISANHIGFCKKAGIKSLGGDVHNLHITGNDIEYNNRPGEDRSPNGEPTGAEIWFDAREGVISEVSIVSNTIQATVQPGGCNVRIWGKPETPPLAAVLISVTGNVIGSQTRGIELRHAQRVAISGNTLYDAADVTLYAAHCSGVSFSGNTVSWKGTDDLSPRDGVYFEDCDNVLVSGISAQRLCSGSAERGAGVSLVRCRDASISDCQILDSLHRGIELDSCERCRVTNNTIVDRRAKPTMRQAIRVVGASRHNQITGNIVGGAVDQALQIPEATGVVRDNLNCSAD